MPLVYTHPRIEAEYVRRVRLVNEATDEHAHRAAENSLDAWFTGVAFALKLDEADQGRILMAGDNHYIDQDVDRPMCGGVWLDWTPQTPTPPRAAADAHNTESPLQ